MRTKSLEKKLDQMFDFTITRQDLWECENCGELFFEGSDHNCLTFARVGRVVR